jgi:hypothetical protein
MEFVAPYPNVVAEDKIIDNVVGLLSDEEYQTGALVWAGRDMALSPYTLVTASAVPREVAESLYLLIDDIVTEDLRDTGQGLTGVLRFNVYQHLSEVAEGDATDRLLREAIRRNLAVEAMLKARAARAVIFDGFNVGGRAQVRVTRRDASGTIPGQPSYRRFPSVGVVINFTEGP